MSILIMSEVWQHAPVGNGDLLVLLRISDAAGDDHRMMWESVKTIAKRTRMSERSVYNCLRSLEELNIIESVEKEDAPREASLYRSVVRRIRPVEDWIDPKTVAERALADHREKVRDRFEAKPGEFRRKVLARDGAVCRHCGETDETLLVVDHKVSIYDGGTNDLDNLQILCDPCNTRKGRRSEVAMQNLQGSETRSKSDTSTVQNLHPEQVSYNPNNPIGDIEVLRTSGAHRAPIDDDHRPGARGWDAVQPLRRGGRKSKKQLAEERAQAELELDPAYVVSQALAEEAPAARPSGRLPASDDDLAPPVRRSRQPRSKSPAEKLADYFAREAKRVGHPVPGTNRAALTRNLRTWLAESAEYGAIVKMIDTYWSPDWRRSDNTEAWKDFQNQRGAIVQRLAKATKATQTEADRYDESAW